MANDYDIQMTSVVVISEKNVYINELLTYLSCYMHNNTLANIKKNILSFYSFEDIIEAKKLL